MNNNTNKVNNPMKVITGPDTRWSYANVWEAKSINGGTPKFSDSLIIPKPDTKTVAKVKAAIDVPVDTIFKELSRQEVYGEIQKEAEWITRDTELLGIDILTAIRRGSMRSPSQKFQDFLQGVVTTSTSGGQLKPYFLIKAEEYEKENKLALKQTMETLSMMGESYVTVVVAFPLFLVVILAIMAIIGGNAANTVMILYLVVGLMIPLSQFGFIFVVWNMSQE